MAEAAPEARRYQTLLVEDDDLLQSLYIAILSTDTRIQIVKVCGRESEIREFLESQPPLDLALVDRRLPSGEGHIALLQAYLARQTETSGFVFMSGYADQHQRPDDLPPHVAHHFLGKPFRADELRTVIDQVIAHIEAQTEVPRETVHEAPPDAPFTTPIESFTDFRH